MQPATRVRIERERDREAVRAVNVDAFGSPDEARLVEALRERARPLVSLVAEDDAGAVVGHILFSPVTLSGHEHLRIMGLAPMAVRPGHQRRGIGSALVRAGLEHCRGLGYGAVVVLGHPEYYPRFGFVPSAPLGIACEYDAPPEAFLVVELEAGYLAGASGTIRYHEAFGELDADADEGRDEDGGTSVA